MDTSSVLMFIADKLPQDYAASQMIKSHLDKMNDKQREDVLNKLQLTPLKSPITTLLYAIFLGIFGVDMFYLQQQTKAILKLCVCFATPFLAVMIAVIFDTQEGSIVDDILMVIWAVSSCIAVVWWIKDIIFANKNTKKQNFDTVLMILLQSEQTNTQKNSLSNDVKPLNKESTVAESVIMTTVNADNSTTAVAQAPQTENKNNQNNNAQEPNTQDNQANSSAPKSDTPEEKPKTFWDKINAFFKNPIVIVVMGVLVVGTRYYKVNRASTSMDYTKAQEAYKEKNYEKALKLYEEICTEAKISMTKKDSCHKAADMYEEGLGTKKNPQKAYEIYAKYCDEDKNARLCNAASVMLYKGRGIKKDLELSSQYIQKAIKLKPESKTYYYHAAYIVRDLGEISKANEYLKQACEYGEEKACNQSFKAPQEARNTFVEDEDYSEDMQDIKTIIKDMKSFCYDGLANCNDLNEMPQEYQRMKKSCDSGDLRGCNELGHWYFNNSQDDMIEPEIGDKHYKKALKVWDKACKGLYADSCYVIGYTYYDRSDNATAFKYLSKACSLGHSDACDIKEHLSEQGY